MTRKARTAALLFCTVWLGVVAHSGAYCRTRTCDRADPEQECDVDEDDCVTSGVELYWASDCVTFGVQRDGSISQEIDADEVSKLASRAFSRWLSSSCEDGNPALRVGYLGPVSCAISQYNSNGRNANIIMFRDGEWPYDDIAIDTYGFTRIRFDVNTGEIFDADIELNTAQFNISARDGDPGADLDSILTHEIGHFLGLSHAARGDREATMTPNWNGIGTEMRSLTDDDQAGICAIYPNDRVPTSTSCDPRHGFASECNAPLTEPPAEAACSISYPAARGSLPGAIVLGALGGVAWARRRQRRHRPAQKESGRSKCTIP